MNEFINEMENKAMNGIGLPAEVQPFIPTIDPVPLFQVHPTPEELNKLRNRVRNELINKMMKYIKEDIKNG